MSKIGNKRLLILADKLEEVSERSFNLAKWINYRRTYRVAVAPLLSNSVLKADLKPEEFEECGTSACAVGWAGTIPQFQKLGFTMDIREAFCDPAPSFQGHRGWYATHAFFDLNWDSAHSLFSKNSPAYRGQEATPKFVAQVIRDFVQARKTLGSEGLSDDGR